MTLAKAHASGLNARRHTHWLRDGDDDLCCFLWSGLPTRYEQHGIRTWLRNGEAVILDHARPCDSFWHGGSAFVLRLPRAALPGADAAAGRRHARQHPMLKLLHPYVRSVWRHAEAAGDLPEAAENNVVALVAALAAKADQAVRRARRPALIAARVAAMREVIGRRAAEPDLGMAAVAAEIGLSERSGHLMFAAAGLVFSECVTEARLEAIQTWFRDGRPGPIIDLAFAAGFGDIANFNRVFRRRFGKTPTEMRRSE